LADRACIGREEVKRVLHSLGYDREWLQSKLASIAGHAAKRMKSLEIDVGDRPHKS